VTLFLKKCNLAGALMPKFKEEFEVLIGLGLTSRQSKIYLAIAGLEMATAKTISTVSGVRRENVYRIIPQLQEIGLIEKIIDTPIKFRAIEIKDAVLILLNQRIKQTDKLQKEAKIVIKNFKKKRRTQ
jgi:sugar-specific transcriptional regulator TrmB